MVSFFYELIEKFVDYNSRLKVTFDESLYRKYSKLQ